MHFLMKDPLTSNIQTQTESNAVMAIMKSKIALIVSQNFGAF